MIRTSARWFGVAACIIWLAISPVFGQGKTPFVFRDAGDDTGLFPHLAGIRGVLLHALSEDAKRFYVHHGFAESPVDPMTMMITLADVEKALGG